MAQKTAGFSGRFFALSQSGKNPQRIAAVDGAQFGGREHAARIEIARLTYKGPIKVGMVFDWEKGKKHLYERLTIGKVGEGDIWAWGRSGQTYYEEAEFRRAAIFVAEKIPFKRPIIASGLVGNYEGPIEVGMDFDFEPGKKHKYERLRISRKEGQSLWTYGRCGETYFEEPEFRKHVLPVPPQS